jgi:hypothetical protein
VAVSRENVTRDDADGAARSYGRVLLVWVLVLAGLYIFQEYFS